MSCPETFQSDSCWQEYFRNCCTGCCCCNQLYLYYNCSKSIGEGCYSGCIGFGINGTPTKNIVECDDCALVSDVSFSGSIDGQNPTSPVDDGYVWTDLGIGEASGSDNLLVIAGEGTLANGDLHTLLLEPTKTVFTNHTFSWDVLFRTPETSLTECETDVECEACPEGIYSTYHIDLGELDLIHYSVFNGTHVLCKNNGECGHHIFEPYPADDASGGRPDGVTTWSWNIDGTNKYFSLCIEASTTGDSPETWVNESVCYESEAFDNCDQTSFVVTKIANSHPGDPFPETLTVTASYQCEEPPSTGLYRQYEIDMGDMSEHCSNLGGIFTFDMDQNESNCGSIVAITCPAESPFHTGDINYTFSVAFVSEQIRWRLVVSEFDSANDAIYEFFSDECDLESVTLELVSDDFEIFPSSITANATSDERTACDICPEIEPTDETYIEFQPGIGTGVTIRFSEANGGEITIDGDPEVVNNDVEWFDGTWYRFTYCICGFGDGAHGSVTLGEVEELDHTVFTENVTTINPVNTTEDTYNISITTKILRFDYDEELGLYCFDTINEWFKIELISGFADVLCCDILPTAETLYANFIVPDGEMAGAIEDVLPLEQQDSTHWQYVANDGTYDGGALALHLHCDSPELECWSGWHIYVNWVHDDGGEWRFSELPTHWHTANSKECDPLELYIDPIPVDGGSAGIPLAVVITESPLPFVPLDFKLPKPIEQKVDLQQINGIPKTSWFSNKMSSEFNSELNIGWGKSKLKPKQQTIKEQTSIEPIKIKKKTTAIDEVIALEVNCDNFLFAWGDNSFGQLGNSTIDAESSPIQIGSYSWKAVSAGARHSAAIRNDGFLFTWGRNTYGELGDNSTTSKSSPIQIGSNSWIAITANGGDNGSRTMAIRNDGDLFVWGSGSSGILGLDSTTSYSSPVQLGSDNWITVSHSEQHTLAIRDDGLLFAWGRNGSGELGQGDTDPTSSPVQVGEDIWLAASAGGAGHSVAIRNDGLLFAWGRNDSGELGKGDTDSASLPVQIGASKWKSISAGAQHTLGIRDNGHLFTWGNNTSGELGTGNNTSYSSPVQIGSDSWRVISAGQFHSTAIRDDGLLFAWGLGVDGMLGHGTTSSENSPVQIGNSSWYQVEAGHTHTLGILGEVDIYEMHGQLSMGFCGNNHGCCTTTDCCHLADTSVLVILTASEGICLSINDLNVITVHSDGSNSGTVSATIDPVELPCGEIAVTINDEMPPVDATAGDLLHVELITTLDCLFEDSDDPCQNPSFWMGVVEDKKTGNKRYYVKRRNYKQLTQALKKKLKIVKL